MQERIDVLEKKHKELFADGGKPVIIAGPGRVNIIGEHVDYAGGFVLPSAVDREILLAATLRKDNKLKLFSLDYNDGFEVDLGNLVFNSEKRWANYIMGVFFVCKEAGYKFNGANIVFSGNIPQGGGMSSSAALEVAVCYALRLLNGLTFSDIELVKICQKAENRFVGVMCGIMDQFASAMSKAGNLLLIDCRNLDYKLIPADFTGIKIVLADTKKERTLAGSEYNLRREQVTKAAELLGKPLRDISIAEFEANKNKLDPLLQKRARHVVCEIDRTMKAVEALKKNDMTTLGKLLYATHESLKTDYEVSCKELDIMVEIASGVKGVLGSRVMGGGFGGCTITLVKEANVDELKEKILKEYPEKSGKQTEVWVCNLADGVRRIYN